MRFIKELEETEVECSVCRATERIDTEINFLGGKAFQKTTVPSKENGTTYHETDNGLLCEGCYSRRRELLNSDMVTVPEPPSEWRFCQDCGDKIDETRLDGQHCSECDEDDVDCRYCMDEGSIIRRHPVDGGPERETEPHPCPMCSESETG